MDLSVRNLTFAYKKNLPLILDDISFDIPSGKITSILGSNGAGKSTLIKCLNYIHKPTTGKIYVGHNDIETMSPAERARLIGYVPQNTQLQSGLNVWETVLSGRNPHMKGIPSDGDLEIVEKLLHDFTLEKHAFSDISNLSGGERQRVLMARALAQNPQILLLDEPTSNLDMRYQLEVLETLSLLSKEKGITALTIIHDLNMALRYSDFCIVLNQNKIAAIGNPDMVLSVELIHDVYNVGVVQGIIDGKRVIIPQKVSI